MRSYILSLALLLPTLCGAAAPALKVVGPEISQMEGGDPSPASLDHIGGETLFFSCRISGFARSPENRIHLIYAIQAVDPKGVPIAEARKGELVDEILPQDKDWLPKLTSDFQIPPLIFAGEYKIVVKVQDTYSDATVETPVPFRVRARTVEPSDKLAVRNLGFYRREEDQQPMPTASYRNGTPLVVKFDVTGYKYGPNNRLEVSYVASILGAGDRVLWKQPEPAVELTEAFYPQPYVPEFMQLDLEKVSPGSYVVLIQVKDAVGKQTAELRGTFTVQ
jgi:hypothetical protein